MVSSRRPASTPEKASLSRLIRRLMDVADSEKLRCCLEILYVQALLTGGYPMRNHEMQLLNGNLLRLLDWSIG